MKVPTLYFFMVTTAFSSLVLCFVVILSFEIIYQLNSAHLTKSELKTCYQFGKRRALVEDKIEDTTKSNALTNL